MKIELAIKFGSNEIIIYRKGIGMIAKEPAFLAVSQEGGKQKIKAFGKETEALKADKIGSVNIVQPIVNSEVVNEPMAKILLTEILKNVLHDTFMLSKIEAIVAVPCILGEKQLIVLKRVLLASGIDKVVFVRNPITTRHNLSLDPHAYLMVVDIGKYITEISVLSDDNIVFARAYFVGGVDMDKSIITFVSDNKNLEIDQMSAENIKNEVASLYERDMYRTEFVGVDDTGKFKHETITANEVRLAISNVYDAVVKLVEKCLKEVKDFHADISNNGILFVGGGSKVAGLYEYLSKKLDLPIIVPDNPDDYVIIGAQKLINSNIDYPQIKV